ncbi:MAG: sulfurtransferase [Agromyces sp.]
MNRTEVLISPAELRTELTSPEPPVLLDVRWRLDQPDGTDAYLAGHIPTAQYASLDLVFSQHGKASDGRHPLPAAEQLSKSLALLRLQPQSAVVVYDDMNSWAASRAWWVLRDAGFSSVRILDGGWSAWCSNGGEVAVGVEEFAPVPEHSITAGFLPQLDIEEAAARAQNGVLLDARAPERYRGDVEPIDPIAGHIPGARNLPVSLVLDSTGKFKSVEELRHLFEDAGLPSDEPIGVYCGSGVSATPLVVALTIAGFQPELYPGSWSQWSNTPGRAVETGPGRS